MKISNTKDITTNEKIRFMVYGSSGVGKTKLIGTIPEKTLVLNTDKGMRTLSSMDIDYASANSWKEVIAFLDFIKTKECSDKYTWLVFDSISAMTDLLYTELVDNKKLDGFAMWKEYAGFVMKFMRFLRDQQVYNTLSIFEAIDKETESGVTEKSFGVQGSVGGRIPNFYDEVFALRLDKNGNRILQTASSAGWIAKDRAQVLEKTEVADLAIIMDKIRGLK